MLEPGLDILFGTILVVGLLIGMAHFWQWFYSSPTDQDETVFVRSPDGWRLALHRYRPTRPVTGLPVILCHGLSSNRYAFDMPTAPSLARFLREQGRDVWVAELRGSGMSDCPGLRASDVPYSWDFEDHLRKDVPTLIAAVMEQTAAPAIHWVGHSMGGMLALAHLGAGFRVPLASAVTVGSPVDFSAVTNGNFRLLLEFRSLIKRMPVFPLPFLGKLLVPVAYWMPNLLLGIFYAPNLTPPGARRVLALASQIVTSTRLWLDFGRFIETGVFAPLAGSPYLDGLAASKVPLLVIGGSKDGMAPPEAVRAACQASGNPHADECVTFGKATGCVEDYGHMDLLVGPRSDVEVFPSIHAWLEKHDHRVCAAASPREAQESAVR